MIIIKSYKRNYNNKNIIIEVSANMIIFFESLTRNVVRML